MKRQNLVLSKILLQQILECAVVVGTRSQYGNTGRFFYRDEEEMARKEDEDKGCDIVWPKLKAAGWHYKYCNFDAKVVFFLAKGENVETGEEGITKFIGYAQLWRKWVSDESFRTMYDPNGDTNAAVENGAAEAPSPDYNRLGEPSPGVPVVASRPIETPKETGALETSATPTKQKKRERKSGDSKQQSNKRPKKKESSSSSRPKTRSSPIVPVQAKAGAKTETPTAGSASIGSLQLQNRSVVSPEPDLSDLVAPIDTQRGDHCNCRDKTARLPDHDNTVDPLQLSEQNGTITELKRQLEGLQNLADDRSIQIENLTELKDAQRIKIEDLTSLANIESEDHSQFRREKAKEKLAHKKELEVWKQKHKESQEENLAHKKKLEEWKQKYEDLQEEMDQMRMD
mmetsp:Transcript_13147/g.31112  ORF Transcript_13147/g.31112 Transcript_13147/m.31112 type:complete len:400 (+) Transcript_13147:260-1459(+)